MNLPRIRNASLLAAMLFATPIEARDIALADRNSIPVREHVAHGEWLVVWLPSGFGSAAAEIPVARQLAALGVEVWQADLLEARLLPPLESSLDDIPESDIVTLIETARVGGKRVLLLASARAGVPALRGARAWQAAHPDDGSGLAGVILLHPNLFLGPPEPGREAEYHPVVSGTSLPVFILQPEQSPWHWRLPATRAALERGGAPVYTRLLPGVRDRFYSRADATVDEVRAGQRLAAMLHDSARLLAGTVPGPLRASAPATGVPVAVPAPRGLQVYRGDPRPPALTLVDLAGRRRSLDQLRGQVVVVNFWASWCPPCVHEMPSMQRLKQRLAGRPFEILAVNMAESEHTIREFLRTRVQVDFPLLLDRDGAVLRRWKVFVFPTSFVLGPDGQIKYALYGELEWDSDDTVGKLVELLAAP